MFLRIVLPSGEVDLYFTVFPLPLLLLLLLPVSLLLLPLLSLLLLSLLLLQFSLLPLSLLPLLPALAVYLALERIRIRDKEIYLLFGI